MTITYEEFYRTLKPQGDPVADAVVTELLDSGQVENVNKLFRAFATADEGVPAGASPILRDYLESTRKFPDWVDKTKLADTDEFFKHHKTPAAAVQATAGLVGTYLSPMGAKTLHSAHKLDRPARRLSQSTRLFMGMGDNDAFGPKSKLLPTCQKVRLVHAAIRQLHLRSGKWDVEGDGMPVSLLYTAGAMLVFSVGTLDAMARIGVATTKREQEGYFYAWRIIAHWLGIPDDVTDMNVTEGHALWDSARDHEWAPSEAGAILTEGCIELYESYMPPGMKGAVPAFLRQALSDKYADMVKVPKSAYDLGAKAGAAGASLLLNTPVTKNVLVQPVLDALGQVVERVGREAFTARHETEPQMTDKIE
ncbi:MAG: oxygenase MpaB family protein [Pseudonocardiaceae bacterium]